MFKRAILDDNGMQRRARAGDGNISALQAEALTTVGNGTLTVGVLAGGLVLRSGPTAAFTDTSDTAANLDAATPNMDVGDSVLIKYSNTVAFVATLAGGTNVTASGNLTVAANGYKEFLLVKTGTGASAAFNLIGL